MTSGGAAGTRAIVVAGVSLSGKSTFAARLRDALEPRPVMVEGDDLHEAGNRARMESGVPLDEGARRRWIARVAERIAAAPVDGSQILTCSCLSNASRAALRAAGPVVFVFLDLTVDEAQRRALHRLRNDPGHHFQPARSPQLLEGQFRDLERPAAEGDTRVVDADRRVEPGGLEDLVATVLRWLARRASAPPSHP